MKRGMLKVFYPKGKATDKITGFQILQFQRPVEFQKNILWRFPNLILTSKEI